MCDLCDTQFGLMTTFFDEMLDNYRMQQEAGGCRDTPAYRVHDSAQVFMRHIFTGAPGGAHIAWCLAVAVERLMALEAAGLVT
jgi:hypothetical protein